MSLGTKSSIYVIIKLMGTFTTSAIAMICDSMKYLKEEAIRNSNYLFLNIIKKDRLYICIASRRSLTCSSLAPSFIWIVLSGFIVEILRCFFFRLHTQEANILSILYSSSFPFGCCSMFTLHAFNMMMNKINCEKMSAFKNPTQCTL